MRAFVLTTGRSGSVTMARTCAHISNYSVGHESRVSHYGDKRFAYPERHIEVDNRLAWFLGRLDDFPAETTVFVHLARDRDAVARSFLNRWQYAWRGGVIEAFAHTIVMNDEDYGSAERLELCRFYVDTVTANITSFLQDKTHVVEVQIENPELAFRRFWGLIGAQGDQAAALREFGTRYNRSNS